MTHLVIEGLQLLERRSRAHLDAHVVLAVHVPRARVALHVAVTRLRQHRAFPERRRQRRERDRLVERLGGFRHAHRVVLLRDERGVDVELAHARIGLEDVVGGIPLLGPHVAEQVRRDRLARRHLVLAVLGREPAARVALQVLVERLDLLVEACSFPGEVVSGHVVTRAPHRAQVLVTQRARAFVRQIGEADVVGAQPAGLVVPALPGVEQLVVVAAFLEHGLQLHFVAAVLAAVLAVPGLAVLRFHARHDRRELGALRGIVGRRGRHALTQQVDGAARCSAHRLAVELLRLLDRLAESCQESLVGSRAEPLRVDRDVGRLRPAGGIELAVDVGELPVEPGDELVAGLGGCVAHWRDSAQRDGNGCGEVRRRRRNAGAMQRGTVRFGDMAVSGKGRRTQSRPTFVSTR